jgi:O-acetyl-ADP-ribose deacetylase (regulator of RNase III)
VEQKIGDRTFRLVRDDISAMDVEAFVYDITPDMKLGSGFGSAIQMRGGIVIQKELDAIGSCPTGEAVVTQAGILKADHIIHVNGPKFREEDEEGKLRRATTSALRRAEEKGIKRLAIPPIGTGLYQVPLDLCARVMVDTITSHLRNDTSLEEVLMVVVDTREYEPFRRELEKGVRDALSRAK